jgi:sialate O-acetylesterase
VPIGLVGSFIGGTFIEQWIRKENQAECTSTLCGTRDLDAYKCGSLYNGHIAPFVNQTITGLIWYQGENNVRNTAGSIRNKTGCVNI